MNNGTTSLVHPEIRQIHSPSLEPPALPEDPYDCAIPFQALIGPRGGAGHESFNFMVITPVRLAKRPEGTWGRGMLIMPAFEWTAVAQSLAELLSRAVRPTWHEVIDALGRELLQEVVGEE
jgi:hypothetical protein